MTVLKSRPDIRARLPAVVRPGQTFTVTVLVAATRAVDVDFFDVALVGTEKVTVGYGNSQSSSARNVISLRARLLGRGELPAGKSTYSCEVTLPPGSPASYAGLRATVAYELHVHASIPWWPDARAVFQVNVGHPPPAEPLAEPVIYSSAPQGPQAREGFVEVSLPLRTVAVGDVLRGAVALGNVQWTRYRALKLTLTATEGVMSGWGGPTRSEVSRFEAELPIVQPTEGQALPFSFRLPANAAPTSRAATWTLDWHFEVRAQVRFGSDVVVGFPVILLPPHQPGTAATRSVPAATRLAPPTVGSERVQEVWRGAGQATGLELQGDTLTGAAGAAGEVRLVLRRDHRGERGLFVVAELSYPPLGLGLRREERLMRAPIITGREARQVDAFLDHLARARAPFEVVHLDDTQLRAEVRDAGQNRGRLIAIAQDAWALARAVAAAHAEVLPPAAMAAAVPAWTELATELHGRLQPGGMAIRGEYEGHGIEVRTEWLVAERPDRTVVDLRPRAPLAVTAQTPLADGDARALAERLAEDARSFSVSAERLTVILDAPADLTAVRDALRRMARLCALLQPVAGVYR